MNWLHFLTWVTCLYLVYYLILVAFDHSRNKKPLPPHSGELTFSEDIVSKQAAVFVEQTVVSPKPVKKPDAPLQGSGGVSLKALFDLCREEAIIYTRPVSF